jgi:hypothetical protein
MNYTAFTIVLTVFFTIIQIFVSIGYVRKRKNIFVLENIALYFIYLLFLFIQYKWKFYVETYLLLFVIITTLGHTLIGEYFDIYIRVKLYDRCLHAFGTFSFALFFYSIIAKTMKPVVSPWLYPVLFIITLGVTLGALFEILEFVVDQFFHTKSQSGLKDTNVDLIADIIGSVIAGLMYTSFII